MVDDVEIVYIIGGIEYPVLEDDMDISDVPPEEA